MKLALDQTADYSNKELHSFLKGINLPDFVKSAELDTEDSIQGLSKEAFADKWNKAFPIHTASSTYVSNAYFFNKKAELKRMWGQGYVDAVEANLKNAAAIWDISDQLDTFNKEAEAKNTKDYTCTCIHIVKCGEENYELYPFSTVNDLVKAAESFVSGISSIPFDWRADIAKGFVKAAEQHGVEELPDLICKYAGMYYPNVPAIKEELWYRATKLNKAADKKHYTDLIDDVDNVESTADVYKLAETVYYIEKMAGLYDVPERPCILRDPVDAFFTLPIDKVAEIMNVVEMGGARFDMDDLKKISADTYKEAFGFSVDPSDEGQLRDVLPTMPRSDVALFREISGVAPIS